MRLEQLNDIEDILRIPKPWGKTRGDGASALTDNGKHAMLALLAVHHDCLDNEKVLTTTDKKAGCLLIADAAQKFIDSHQESAPCVEPHFPPEAICVLMALLKIQMLFQAGVIDENGNSVQ